MVFLEKFVTQVIMKSCFKKLAFKMSAAQPDVVYLWSSKSFFATMKIETSDFCNLGSPILTKLCLNKSSLYDPSNECYTTK